MKTNDFAPGLPSKSFFSNINQSGPTRLVIQQHDAEKAGKHYDMRLHDNDKTLSWVIKSLPGEKKKILAIRQPDHRPSYSDFEGKISEGYGKGNVKKVYDEGIDVLEASNKKIRLELPEGNFLMIKPKKFGKKNWLMIKTAELAFMDELEKLSATRMFKLKKRIGRIPLYINTMQYRMPQSMQNILHSSQSAISLRPDVPFGMGEIGAVTGAVSELGRFAKNKIQKFIGK